MAAKKQAVAAQSGKTLVIAEKPSVAADVAKVVGAKEKHETHFEGEDYLVSWAVGHLLELVPPEAYDEKYKRWKLQDLPIIPDRFQREPIARTKKQLQALTKLIARKDVVRVVNGCDAGREGELIFREIYRHADSKKPVDRLWLQSMTADSIRKSIAAPRKLEDVEGLADAADCRAESDWLIGMNASRAITVRLRSAKDRNVWSAGRVQTAALAMAVRREREILAHEPKAYWVLRGTFKAEGGSPHEYEGTWQAEGGDAQRDRIMDPAERDAILARVSAAKSALATETRKDRSETAPPLHDLSTLQQEANRRHGYSARRTLDIAQTLYEARKLVTYPRTDSKALPSDYRDHVRKALEALVAHPSLGAHADRLLKSGLSNEKRNFNDAEVRDHFAIIPTGEAFPTDLPQGEREIFDLIVKRFLASFHPPAISTDVERTTKVGRDNFRTKRSVLKVPGWKAVLEREAAEDGTALPPLPAGGPDGAVVQPLRFDVDEKETKPPARLTEASLLKLMETAGRDVDDEKLSQVLHDAGGIGTPATRADIIETLLSREYMDHCQNLDGKKALRATARGIRLVEALERIELPLLTSPELTAQLEDALRDMEHGKREREQYMASVRDWTQQIVDRVRAFSFDTLYEGTPPVGTCPACGSPVREMLRVYQCEKGGREGTCKFVLWKEVSGRWIDRATAEQLLRSRQTPPKAGFFSKTGREYEAMLKLSAENEVEIQARNAGGGEEVDASVVPLDLAPCPFHPDLLVRRSGKGYRCDANARSKKECKLSLPLTLCQRPMAPEEIAQLIGPERKTAVLDGFISRKGRPFRASLSLGDDARLKWEFPPREKGARGAMAPRAPRKEFPVDPTPVGRCPRHPKADVIETPTDYACSEPGCKLRVPRELCHRPISREEAATLVKDRTTSALEGFVSKKGKPFAASLKLNLRKAAGWEFDFGR